MNGELAQVLALITHGNAYLSSSQKDAPELFPAHSTFRYVSEVSFQRETFSFGLLRRHQVISQDTHTWFAVLRAEEVQKLRLGLLQEESQLPPHVANAFAGGGAWVIQTNKQKSWRAKWSVVNQDHPQHRIWAVEYWETGELPIKTDFPDLVAARENLEKSLVEARDFSERCKLNWEKSFTKAIELLGDSAAVVPYHADLLPQAFENRMARQLISGAAKAWVFGGMGSWSDVHLPDAAQKMEYQHITRNLYQAVLQAFGAVANSTH